MAKVETFPTHESITEADLAGSFVMAVDVLRATSVIATALEHGATAIIPAEEIDEAMEIFRVRDGEPLLCGERECVRIEGFHLGNSPLEFTRHAVAGRTLIMSTSNGTRTFRKAARAHTVVAASLLNARACAEAALRTGCDVSIVCAGTYGRYSGDDVLCAGAIVDVLTEEFEFELDDLSRHARDVWRMAKSDTAAAFALSTPGKRLTELGMGDDVAYCAQRDIFHSVPVFVDGRLEKM